MYFSYKFLFLFSLLYFNFFLVTPLKCNGDNGEIICKTDEDSCFIKNENSITTKGCLKTNKLKNICNQTTCLCDSDNCNINKMPFQCHVCFDCNKTKAENLKSCPNGAMGCFSLFEKDQLKAKGCAFKSSGAYQVDGIYSLSFCDLSNCNENLNTAPVSFDQKLTSDRNFICHECKDCDYTDLDSLAFCLSGNSCYETFENEKVNRGCIDSKMVGYQKTSDFTGWVCNEPGCNNITKPSTFFRCLECTNCKQPYPEVECFIRAKGCYANKDLNELGCNYNSSTERIDSNSYCSESKCNFDFMTTTPTQSIKSTTPTNFETSNSITTLTSTDAFISIGSCFYFNYFILVFFCGVQNLI